MDFFNYIICARQRNKAESEKARASLTLIMIMCTIDYLLTPERFLLGVGEDESQAMRDE